MRSHLVVSGFKSCFYSSFIQTRTQIKHFNSIKKGDKKIQVDNFSPGIYDIPKFTFKPQNESITVTKLGSIFVISIRIFAQVVNSLNVLGSWLNIHFWTFFVK